MNVQKVNKFPLSALMLVLLVISSITGWAQEPTRSQRVIVEVQRIDTDDVINIGNSIQNLDGVAFPPGANTLLTLNRNNNATLILVDPEGEPISIPDIPFFNIAYDGASEGSSANGMKSIFIVDDNELLSIERKSDGLDAQSLRRQTLSPVADARGVTLDPINDRLFTLQVNMQGQAALVITQCMSGRDCSSQEARRTRVALPASVSRKSHGLAFNPENGHVYVLDRQTLHEFNLPDRADEARLVKSYGLSQLQLGSPITFMTFVKSLDQTDADTNFNLFVATSDVVIELAFPISLPAVAKFFVLSGPAATLIQTIDASQFSPPSPDTAGLTYLQDSGTLLATDSEVNEIPSLFTGVNVFEIDPDPVPGVLIDTFTTFPGFSNEPTGIAYNPLNQHLFITDDNRNEVFETDLNFNLIRQFDTVVFGSNDPEGIAFDPGEGALYIADGVNREIYKVMPGSNGIFDGIAPAGDDVVTSFDTCRLGVEDPEGITFQVETSNLFIIGDANPGLVCDPNNEHNNQVAQVTTSGAVVRTIDISAPNPNIKNSAGIAVAPSTSSGGFRLYVAARGLDNNPHPDENDGMIYEFSVPGLTAGNTLDIRVSTGSDDAEEKPAGSVIIGSVDLDLVASGGNQTVGMRFNNVTIPQGSTIVNAYIQFTAAQVRSTLTTLALEGEAVDNATTFVNNINGHISTRPTTIASVPWFPAPWTAFGAAGFDQRTPDLTPIVQEIVNRSNWVSNNSLAIIVTGSGKREAISFEANALAAPLLHVEFVNVTGNLPPTALISSPTDGSSFTVGDDITFTGTGTDPEDGNVTANLTWNSNLDGVIGTGGDFSTIALSEGTHTIIATATDSGSVTGSDTITITVLPPRGGTTIISIPINLGSDDAEEKPAGSVIIGSLDLDLVASGGNQTVGMRFNNVTIPQGSTIVDASIQFTAAQVRSTATSLTLEGEAAGNSTTFVNNVNGDISTRPRTSLLSSVSWSPVPWTVIGEAGVDQRTPNLAPVIQEIVNRGNWTSSNSLAIIISGSGKREAISFDANPSAAPLLRVEYQ